MHMEDNQRRSRKTNLFRVSAAQHEVGSFNVCMHILVLMNILQDVHLAKDGNVNQCTTSLVTFVHFMLRILKGISPVLVQAGELWPSSVDLRCVPIFSEGHCPVGPWP